MQRFDGVRIVAQMPRFHFDICTNGVTVHDPDGVELVSVEAARHEAARAAAQMMKDLTLEKAEPADVSIVVRDGSPKPVCTVRVALKIE